MKAARMRLAAAVLLFAAWVGWLAYLASGLETVVLSRPQFLVSDLDVIARVDAPDGPVTILEVSWPPAQAANWEGKTLPVANLREAEGWTGPGAYILPLKIGPDGAFLVAPIPRSPGYEPTGQAPIYPVTPQTRQQLRHMPKPTSLTP